VACASPKQPCIEAPGSRLDVYDFEQKFAYGTNFAKIDIRDFHIVENTDRKIWCFTLYGIRIPNLLRFEKSAEEAQQADFSLIRLNPLVNPFLFSL
jgi:hypothetical protein